MTTKYQFNSIVISIFLLLAFIALAGLFPSVSLMLSVTFLLFSFCVASSTIMKKNREAYLQDKITRSMFVRNTSLEIFGILLAMAFAGLLSRYITQGATTLMSHDFAKILAGILIGVLVGACVGLLVKRTWGRLVKIQQI